MNMKWYHYLICFVVIVLGVFSSIKLVEIFNIKSAEYGKAITIETKNDYKEVSKFDFGSLTFESDDLINYQTVGTFGAQKFDGTNSNYTVLFNGQSTSNVVVSSGKISSNLSVNFYDLNGTKIVQANIHILIEYYASGTKVTMTTTNQNNSVGYLNVFTNINGAVLKVVERS